ncbi:MAG: hypothetical protein AAFY64_06400, partial [Pseudomonadota bacterium]
MPTNFLRAKPKCKPRPKPRRSSVGINGAGHAVDARSRTVWLAAGDVGLPIRLHDTPTADLIWRALPLYAIAETWGQSL